MLHLPLIIQCEHNVHKANGKAHRPDSADATADFELHCPHKTYPIRFMIVHSLKTSTSGLDVLGQWKT